MTAKTLVRERAGDDGIREITARNVAKVTRFRENGEEELERTVRRLETMKGFGKEAKGVEEEEEDDDDDGKEERDPWEPFARMKQREREMEDEERPLTERERREQKRTKRDPNTGRRVQAGYR